jgi:hypothetical protein
LNGKRLELLKEIVRGPSRVAVLGTSTNPGNAQASSTFAFGILEWMDVDEVRKFIDESVKEPQKG